MKKLDEIKKAYEKIPIPDDLDDFMDAVIHKQKMKSKRKLCFRYLKLGLTTAFAVYLIFLNTNSIFAKTLFKVPLVGEVSKLLCVREFKEDNPVQTINVKIPEIKYTGNKKMEDRVNAMIRQHIDATVKRTKKENEEALKNYKALKKPSLTMKTSESIDYKITANKGNLLSFQIITTYMANTSIQEHEIFNLDLKSGKEITLKELFGNSYKQIINKDIREQMQQRTKENANNTYFTGDLGFNGINDKQKFYIDDHNNVVIVFEKYEIAPGSMGKQEFKIPCRAIQKYTQ